MEGVDSIIQFYFGRNRKVLLKLSHSYLLSVQSLVLSSLLLSNIRFSTYHSAGKDTKKYLTMQGKVVVCGILWNVLCVLYGILIVWWQRNNLSITYCIFK